MAKRRMPIPSRSGGAKGGMKKNDMMKQFQKMQEEMLKSQEELEEKEYTATSGGGAVSVTVTGGKKITNISIDPDVIDEDDIEMLEDLILVAANDALMQADEETANQMEKLTGGMTIPGIF